jgi:CRISPR-associated protein Csb2
VLREAAIVSAMLRHASLEAARGAGRDPAWVEQWLAGHGESAAQKSQRFSYLALPHLGAGEGAADPGIAAVVAAGSPSASAVDAAWLAEQLADRLLLPEGGGPPRARLRRVDPAGDAVLERAFGSSCEWVTVTPLVLPGHDDGRSAKAIRLVRRALVQAGLPAELEAEIELAAQPFARIGLQASEYTAPDHLRRLPRHHVRLRLPTALRGPLALGAGRHFGLGLFLVG